MPGKEHSFVGRRGDSSFDQTRGYLERLIALSKSSAFGDGKSMDWRRIQGSASPLEDEIRFFLAHLPSWTLLEIAYLICIHKLGKSSQQAFEDELTFATQSLDTGERFGDMIDRLYPIGRSSNVRIEHAKLTEKRRATGKHCQEMARLEAIRYLLQCGLPQEAFRSDLLAESDATAKRVGKTNTSKKGRPFEWCDKDLKTLLALYGPIKWKSLIAFVDAHQSELPEAIRNHPLGPVTGVRRALDAAKRRSKKSPRINPAQAE
jgi:hypothetical protein